MASFSQMYEQYVEQVYCFLRELSGDDGLAERLTRETFYQAFLHIDSFENRSSVPDWLCEIGKNIYLKERNRRRRSGLGNQLFEDERQISAYEKEACEGEVSGAERKKRIRRGLRRIRCRWICSILAAALLLLLLMAVMLIAGSSAGGFYPRAAGQKPCLQERLSCGGGVFGK